MNHSHFIIAGCLVLHVLCVLLIVDFVRTRQGQPAVLRRLWRSALRHACLWPYAVFFLGLLWLGNPALCLVISGAAWALAPRS